LTSEAGPTGAASEHAANSPPATQRRRKRDRVGLVAGVATVVCVVGIVLAAAVGALFLSGVVPLAGLQHHVAADLQRRLGPDWRVTAAKAAIVRTEGQAVLQIRNAEFAHASGLRLRTPDTDIRYDPWSLLSGSLRITSIDLHGVNLRLKVDGAGALTLDTGDGQVPLQADEAVSALGPVEQAASALGALLDNDSVLPGLDSVALTGSKLTLVAPDGTERIGLQNVSLHLDRVPDGRTLRLRGAAASGAKDIVVSRRPDGQGGKRLDIAINAFQIDSVERLVAGPASAVLTGFPLSGRISLVPVAGQPARLEGSIRIGAGTIASPDGGKETVGFAEATAAFAGDAALQRVEITPMQVRNGQTELAMSGVFERDRNDLWQFRGEASGTIAGEGKDPVQPLTRATIALEGSGLNVAVLTALDLQGPGLVVQGSGRLERTAEGPTLVSRLTVTDSQARGLMAAWPAPISPIIRNLLVERIEAGTIDALTLVTDMSADAVRAARAGDPTPDESLRVEVKGRGVRFVVGDGIPKLHDMAISGVGTGRTLALTASSARVNLPKGRSLQLSDGSFGIADTWATRPIGRAAFRTVGGVDALAALMAQPALRESAPAQIDPDTVKGRVDLRTSLSLPLVDKIAASDVIIQSTGSISGLASTALIGDEALDNGNLAATYERGSLSLKGEARIDGAPAQIDLRQDGRGVGEAVVTLTVDQAMRQRRGLGFNGTVNGPVALRVVKPLGRKPDAPPRLEVDLSRTVIDGALPGWSKPAGRPGKLTFALVENDKDETELVDLILDSSPVLLRGRALLDDSGALIRASFTQARLSPGDDMRVEVRREGQTSKITVRGQVADARPFLKPLSGSAGPKRPGDGPPDLDLDLAIPILTGFNSEVIGNAVLKLGVRAKELRQIEFSGRIGRAPVTVQQAREGAGRMVRLRSDDGGALLRYLDIYRRAYGGEFSIDARPTEDGMSGDVTFRNFRVQGEPALRRVIAEQFSQPGREGQGGGRAREAGNDVPFARLKGSFVRTPSRIEIRDGVIWGNEIGISGQGSIDYARDRADIAGTFVPGFALNNAFSQVPLLGPLLGGGQYEGLFAVNFRVAGPASAPTMTINPLSAIAPGILRRFVDPFGGVPLGAGNAPARAP
jgi:hypothetical protein